MVNYMSSLHEQTSHEQSHELEISLDEKDSDAYDRAQLII